MAYSMRDTSASTITYFESARAATSDASHAGERGIALFNKQTKREGMILKNDVWASRVLDCLTEHTVSSPPDSMWSNNYVLYDKGSRIMLDVIDYQRYAMLSYIATTFRVDKVGVFFKKYSPLKPMT